MSGTIGTYEHKITAIEHESLQVMSKLAEPVFEFKFRNYSSYCAEFTVEKQNEKCFA